MNKADSPVVVLISANAEWLPVLAYYQNPPLAGSPYGGYFQQTIMDQSMIFFKSGWGKISAAASTQYAIQAFAPRLLINLGTCGGFEEKINPGEVFLAEETLVYDIYERMGDAAQAVKHYSTRLDLSFLREPLPLPVRRGKLISADQDIDPVLVPHLIEQYHAVAADWESGAIAWTAAQNHVPCLILRGVSDVVGPENGDASYANLAVYHTGAEAVMKDLLSALPGWIECSLDAK
jgi:adenosylhomocysteine nucleosidase